MRSAVIVFLFLFSILFLGAQAAQLDPLEPVEEAASNPAQHADAGLQKPAGPLQPVGFTTKLAD